MSIAIVVKSIWQSGVALDIRITKKSAKIQNAIQNVNSILHHIQSNIDLLPATSVREVRNGLDTSAVVTMGYETPDWNTEYKIVLKCSNMHNMTTVRVFTEQCTAYPEHGCNRWNSLPSHLRHSEIGYNDFKRQLKTFLFGETAVQHIVTLVLCAL